MMHSLAIGRRKASRSAPVLRAWALALALTAPGAADAAAQLPADARWQTIRTERFRVTYEPQLHELARHAAASAERAHAALSVLVADPPRGTIDIVLADHVDLSNGYATPFPSNRIVLYAKPPIDVLELQFTHDWIDMVVVHELAHVFHLDVAGGIGRLVRSVFGRVPLPWPVFPAVGTPLWALEGLAVGIESTVTGFGRAHGSYHEMVVRTAALEGDLDDLHRLGSASPVWPGTARAYIYGSLFMDYLARRFGPDATARIVRSTAGATLPPPLWFGQVGRSALGVSFLEAYADWRRELEQRYTELRRRLETEGLTATERLTPEGRYAMHPRHSPDGARIAYTRSDGRSEPGTRTIDARTGSTLHDRIRNDVGPLAWMPDGALVTSDLQYVDRFRVHSDLYIERDGDRRRLTRGLHIQDPDVRPDGRRTIAVQNRGGTNRLVLVDPESGALRAITPFDPDVHWSLPRWAPDGQRVAVSRWQMGGRFDIVVIDTMGVILAEVTDGTGVNAGPAWSPDGNWIVFSSDRSGIPNLYAAGIGVMGGDHAGGAGEGGPPRPAIRQVTSVLTGAFFPDVSPDGRSIIFSAYHHDGFHIERIPFEPSTWRDPQPAVVAELPFHRVAYTTPVPRDAFADSIVAAVARRDTIAGPAQPYRPGPHMMPRFWAPTYERQAGDGYVGAWLQGQDLVDRHAWSTLFAVAPANGRTLGAASYTYRGLPTLRIGLHPALTFSYAREWDTVLRDQQNDLHIDEREDRAAAGFAFSSLRWRRSTGFSIVGEYATLSRTIVGGPGNLRLANPRDELIGPRASATFAAFAQPAFAISRENGFVVQLSARDRHDRTRAIVQTQDGERLFDGSYRELTTWNAAYLALPLRGFARHVVALRASALIRDGRGASATGIGGASATGLVLPGLTTEFGGLARFLPVRGYPADERTGTRAWTASAEYRFPLSFVSASLAPLPIYFDRLAGSIFADAGHAWCTADDTARIGARLCNSTSATGSPLFAAGTELTGFFSLWGAPMPVRIGFALPFQHDADGRRRPSVHFVFGTSF